MKQIKYFLVVAFASILLVNTGCIKDKLGSMEASISGTQWDATLASVIAVQYDTYVTIVGINANGSGINISIKATDVGTYTLQALESELETFAIYYLSSDWETDGAKKYLSSSGTVTITEFADGKISGTFSFTALNSLQSSVEITSGTFTNVPYL
jgi:hypothetical protein